MADTTNDTTPTDGAAPKAKRGPRPLPRAAFDLTKEAVFVTMIVPPSGIMRFETFRNVAGARKAAEDAAKKAGHVASVFGPQAAVYHLPQSVAVVTPSFGMPQAAE
jgi:hypothetical protein